MRRRSTYRRPQTSALLQLRGGKSITEFESLHGVLNNLRMEGRTICCFKATAYGKFEGRVCVQPRRTTHLLHHG